MSAAAAEAAPPAKKPKLDSLALGIKMLKEKGVYADRPDKQAFEFACLSNEDYEPLDGARKRLKMLMATEHDKELGADDLHTYNPEEFPGHDVYMIDDEKTCVQRHQRTGLCYLHAPVVVKYYAQWWAKRDALAAGDSVEEHEMIDLTAYILEYFNGRAMEQYIFHDNGGDSKSALEGFLQPGSIMTSAMVKDVPAALQQFGPALVAAFKVHEDFLDHTVRHHHGMPEGEVKGLHAMALVGSRTGDDGKLYLLLQNWWSDKQFVEVDAEYFEACGAVLHFIKTPQTEPMKKFPTHTGHILQTEAITMSEKYTGERALV